MREVVGQIVFERSEMGETGNLKLELFGPRDVGNATYLMVKGEAFDHAIRRLFKLYLGEGPLTGRRDLKNVSEEMEKIARGSGICPDEAKLVGLVIEGFDIVHDALRQWKVTNDARRG